MSQGPAKVGLVGCGAISARYIENSKQFEAFDIVAVADLRPDAAKARAEEFGVPKAYTPEELLADPEIEIVLNLTSHAAHGQVGLAALEAGKHVYHEKPFVVHREEGRKMLALAAEKGLRTGAAPDTFLGGAWQTARQLIDEGAIGEPIGASACLMAYMSPGNQQAAGGEEYVTFYKTNFFDFGVTWAFDRTPYYMHAIINLIGPVRRVTGSAQNTWASQERFRGVVKTPTHFAGVLDFANGAVGTLLMTSDVHGTGLPHVEIYGTEGSLRCIDPNCFGGGIFVRKPDSPELQPVECRFGYNANGRGVGLADMASAIRNNRPHRASGQMGYHVVDMVHALHEASEQGRHIELESTCERPAPLPAGLEDGQID